MLILKEPLFKPPSRTNGQPKPLRCVVDYCRTGVGRAGTFIAVDAVLKRLTVIKTVDVFSYVSSLRQCRQGMVGTLVSTNHSEDSIALISIDLIVDLFQCNTFQTCLIRSHRNRNK